MWKDAYLENQVLTADPLELVRILYRAAIDFVGRARTDLAAGDILARSNAIGRAQAILGELNASLDHQTGGEISRNLAALYVYMHGRLTEANLRQQDAPLALTEELLTTLSKAWEQADAPEAGVSAPALQFQTSGVFSGGDSHMWSA